MYEKQAFASTRAIAPSSKARSMALEFEGPDWKCFDLRTKPEESEKYSVRNPVNVSLKVAAARAMHNVSPAFGLTGPGKHASLNHIGTSMTVYNPWDTRTAAIF